MQNDKFLSWVMLYAASPAITNPMIRVVQTNHIKCLVLIHVPRFKVFKFLSDVLSFSLIDAP
ncbi:hypothetical protein AYK87_20730 [Stutzerimonas stutzeri]|nr:hypothetical protein AYK87_20730 [Stutzerimonas stutzeri]HAN54081.1 hypothetical protein [Pseudomonas sp.]